MAREYTFEEIEAYLAGTQSDEMTIQIEEEMRNNPSFAEAVEKHRNAHSLVQHYAIGQLKNKVKRIQTENVKAKATTIPWMRIAASLLIVVIAGGYFFIRNEYRADQLFEDSFTAYPNQFSVMGSAENNFFTEGLQHYDSHEYEEAIASFSKIPSENEFAVPSRLYLGISYLALNQPAPSISTFEKLIEKGTTYSDAARWYLALAYLKNGDELKARNLLDDIVRIKGFQSQQAERLLQKLKSPMRKLPGI
jgi:tetratricopeptide (TPR) repeat protein